MSSRPATGCGTCPILERRFARFAGCSKTGGLLLSLDFNRPASAPVRAAYHAYLTVVGSALGLVLHGDADTYRYIPESIRRYPGADRVVELLRFERLPRGAVATRAWRPDGDP